MRPQPAQASPKTSIEQPAHRAVSSFIGSLIAVAIVNLCSIFNQLSGLPESLGSSLSALKRVQQVVGQRSIKVVGNDQLAFHGANSMAFGFSCRHKLRHRTPMLGDSDHLAGGGLIDRF